MHCSLTANFNQVELAFNGKRDNIGSEIFGLLDNSDQVSTHIHFNTSLSDGLIDGDSGQGFQKSNFCLNTIAEDVLRLFHEEFGDTRGYSGLMNDLHVSVTIFVESEQRESHLLTVKQLVLGSGLSFFNLFDTL